MTPAILMVMMEPPIALEPEFHDWYDTELIPDHLRVPGIRSGSRWLCLNGWPRHMAFYELDALSALEDVAYRAISGKAFSPWSRWMLDRVAGRERLVLEQVRGDDLPVRPNSRGLALMRLVGHCGASIDEAVDRLQLPSPCRARVFHTVTNGELTWGRSGQETILLIEAPATALIPGWPARALAEALANQSEHLLGLWVYARYVAGQRAPARAEPTDAR